MCAGDAHQPIILSGGTPSIGLPCASFRAWVTFNPESPINTIAPCSMTVPAALTGPMAVHRHRRKTPAITQIREFDYHRYLLINIPKKFR